MRLGLVALATTAVVCSAAVAFAQEEPTEEEGTEVSSSEVTAFNAINVELLGPAGIYSFNYERRVNDVGLRAGFSYFSVSITESDGSSAKASLTTIPLTASYIGIGGRAAKLELGGGGVLAFASGEIDDGYGETSGGSGTGAWATVLVGFRYHPDDGGFQFRIGASPLVGPGGALPWGYLSLGGVF